MEKLLFIIFLFVGFCHGPPIEKPVKPFSIIPVDESGNNLLDPENGRYDPDFIYFRADPSRIDEAFNINIVNDAIFVEPEFRCENFGSEVHWYISWDNIDTDTLRFTLKYDEDNCPYIKDIFYNGDITSYGDCDTAGPCDILIVK